MKTLRRVVDLAAFEARLGRRLVRTWVLGALALGLPILTAGQWVFYHVATGFSGAHSAATRDFWILQSTATVGFVLGLVGIFHAFDWRHRDASTSFAATFDAAPPSRMELAWGRFIGLLPWLFWPYVVLLVLQLAALPFLRVPVSPVVFAFTFLRMALPAALVPTALAFAAAGLFRNRAIAIGLGICYLGASMAVQFGLHEDIAVMASGLTELPLHSLFVGYEPDAVSLWQAAASAALVALCVTLASLGRGPLPRSSGERARQLAVAGTLAVVAAGAFTLTWMSYRRGTTDREAVIAAEKAVAGEAVATVTRRDIEVKVASGRLSGRATLALRNDTAAPLADLRFRLNAGLELAGIEGPSGPVPFRRDLTVVTVTPPSPLRPGDAMSLVFEYEGTLDAASVDADRALAVRSLGGQQRGLHRMFSGSVGAFLHPRVVALGPDAAWYPESGVLLGHEYPSRARQSFAPSTLVVDVPPGWRAASVGRREEVASGFRFTSDEPVPGLSLNAAAYEEVETKVGGLTCRVLYHPGHRANVDFLREARAELEKRVAERLDEWSARTGLSYPYPELSLVEVPVSMAPFAAGWDTPNRLGAPGVVMVRENGLLGAYYRWAYSRARSRFEEEAAGKGEDNDEDVARELDIETAEPQPEAKGSEDELTTFDPGRAKADLLERFAERDWTGGDVERLVFRSLWDHRVQAIGKEAAITGVALSNYQAEVALGRSVMDLPDASRILLDPMAANRVFGSAIISDTVDVTRLVVESLSSLDEIYGILQTTPLEEFDPVKDHERFPGVLYVKGRRPLEALRAALAGRWPAVSQRLQSSPDRHFDWAAFREALLSEAAPEDAATLAVLLDNWFSGTKLPGFVVTHARVQRLSGEEELWQVTARVANRGDAPGIAKMSAFVGRDARSRVLSVPAGADVEVGLSLDRKPDRWSLSPFLALNRDAPTGSFETDETPLAAEPFDGTRPAPLVTTAEPVIVDNLDAGFTVTLADGREVPYAAPGDGDELKEWNGWRPPRKWTRWRSRARWYRPFGLFDFTGAVKSGTEEGRQPARWRVVLPEPGTYRVEAFLPKAGSKGPRKVPEKYAFVVTSEAGGDAVSVDLSTSEAGWVDLGRFRFGREGEVLLEDRGKGLIVADAVRFVPEAS